MTNGFYIGVIGKLKCSTFALNGLIVGHCEVNTFVVRRYSQDNSDIESVKLSMTELLRN